MVGLKTWVGVFGGIGWQVGGRLGCGQGVPVWVGGKLWTATMTNVSNRWLVCSVDALAELLLPACATATDGFGVAGLKNSLHARTLYGKRHVYWEPR